MPSVPGIIYAKWACMVRQHAYEVGPTIHTHKSRCWVDSYREAFHAIHRLEEETGRIRLPKKSLNVRRDHRKYWTCSAFWFRRASTVLCLDQMHFQIMHWNLKLSKTGITYTRCCYVLLNRQNSTLLEEQVLQTVKLFMNSTCTMYSVPLQYQYTELTFWTCPRTPWSPCAWTRRTLCRRRSWQIWAWQRRLHPRRPPPRSADSAG